MTTTQLNVYPTGSLDNGVHVALSGAQFETTAARDEFVARFPRYVGVKASTKYPIAWFEAAFQRNGSTGEFNETGAKRLRKLLEVLGDDVEFAGNADAIAIIKAIAR
ncbi:hypothetical protein SEA_ZIPP_3 [Gordonia phage Zipp]|uniref:Uncharacterized protein n=1 Tax=Gordonia phage Zipp TaxID=2591212 RepID=A0A514DHS9_9CAUD|nr:hypothetical protein J1775_gp03 [Gordonia phage Zipp]QDH93157.1 hypothetical protein SEA_ZIPP_3 [Gordonia phage Zipp]